MITIQKISPSKNLNIDLNIITQLRSHLNTPEKISDALQQLEQNGSVFFIAQEKEKIIGFLSGIITYNLYLGNFFLIDDLIIDENQRGKNIGSQLLEEVETFVKEKNITTIKVDSGLQRLQAHHFYEKNGYEKKCYTFEKRI